MNIIEKYLLKENMKTFLFGIALFSTLLIVSKLRELLELIINKGINPGIIIMLLIYLLPALLAIAIPMAFILGVIMSIGRLSENKEIIAMYTSGIEKKHIIRSYLIISAFLILFLFYFNGFIIPKSNKMYVKTLFNAFTQKVQVIINEKKFNEINNKLTVYTREYDKKENKLNDINIQMKEDDGILYIFAKTGHFFKAPEKFLYQFIIENGSFSKLQKDDILINGLFKKFTINIDLSEKMAQSSLNSYGIRSQNLKELSTHLKTITNEKEKTRYLVEYNKRFSLALSVLALLGISLFVSLRLKVGSKALGILVAISLIFVYYIFMIIGFDLGDKGKIAPFFAANLPNIIFIIPTIIGFIKA
ncbi:LptF/LptG family permease [bacterium]|nr:LptF/LptG family permease [bacterium]